MYLNSELDFVLLFYAFILILVKVLVIFFYIKWEMLPWQL